MLTCRPTTFPAPSSPSVSTRSRSTTPSRTDAQITVFTREVADPDGGGQAVPGLPPGWPRLRGDPSDEPADGLDGEARSRTTGCCCSTSAAPGAPRRSASIPGDDAGRTQAAYLTHFRADAIVRDCELIRAELGVRPLDRAGPELRRLHVAHLPVDRARGAALRP